MQRTWRLCLLLLPVGGAAVAGLGCLELAGLVPRGALLGEASDAERWVAIAFGLLVQPFGWSALRHARLVIDAERITWLGFGFVCGPRSLPFAEVQRWGHAVAQNRGRRERHLVFEDRRHVVRTVKLAMYRGQDRVLVLLQERLGAPAPASATFGGVRFDAP